MDYQRKTQKILKDCGAFADGGHFVYASGHHGDFYVNKDALYVYPRKLDDICVMMTDVALKTFGASFEVVLAPAVAGIVVGQNIAYNASLLNSSDILFAYAEKNPFDPSYRVIRRGYEDVVRGRRVLLVDDIVSTGNTLAQMAQSVHNLGGEVRGAVVICDRGQVRKLRIRNEVDDVQGVFFDVCVAPLVELDLQTFDAVSCPLCKAGRPIDTQIGEGNISVLKSIGKHEESVIV